MALTKITGEGLGTSINSTNTSGNSTLGLISGTSNSSVINLGDADASNVGQVKYHHGINSMVLRTNATDKITLDSTGNMLFNQSGTGIYLGTTSATAANLLDDYEEGTFTPEVLNGWGVTSPTYSQNEGHYTKIGSLVYIRIKIILSGGSINGNRIKIYQFPFAVPSARAARINGYFATASSNAENVFMVASGGGTTFDLYYQTNTGITDFTGTNAGSGFNCLFTGVYQTT